MTHLINEHGDCQVVETRNVDEEKYVTLEEFMERTAYIEEGHNNEGEK
jgi:hypothetical protein